ncbi:MAG: YggS family pyridoxal phosphate-dependent enzyme [Calditrichaeota bacterium]|nr:MAG: YggS family pyridoxal phosphate-dependent enzyme [Calditrichota bacterium]
MIAENYNKIQDRIFQACQRAGRNPQKVKLLPVSKVHPISTLQEAVDAGIVVFGESKVQEAEQKIKFFGKEIEWHLIGHLQSNKAKKAVELFDFIHSVDSFKLAKELNRHSKNLDKKTNIFLQVNTSLEESKSGVLVDGLVEFAEQVRTLEFLNVKGLMTIGKFSQDEKVVRNCFVTLRNALERLNLTNIFTETLTELSMGMSNDFEIAIEEGATLVRVGTSIFGQRNYTN